MEIVIGSPRATDWLKLHKTKTTHQGGLSSPLIILYRCLHSFAYTILLCNKVVMVTPRLCHNEIVV